MPLAFDDLHPALATHARLEPGRQVEVGTILVLQIGEEFVESCHAIDPFPLGAIARAARVSRP
jgi:hypothetical protein